MSFGASGNILNIVFSFFSSYGLLMFIAIYIAAIFLIEKRVCRNTQSPNLGKKYFDKKSILISVISFIIFYILISVTHVVRYPAFFDYWLFKEYIPIALIGAAIIALKRYYFGCIFYIGTICGYIVECIITFNQGYKITMMGGIYNLLCIAAAYILGFIIEIIVIINKKNTTKSINKNSITD